MKIIVFEPGFETFEMHLENFLVLGGMYFLCISNVAVIGVPVRNIGMFLLPLPGMQCVKHGSIHCVKIFRIWSFSDPYFPAFRLSTDQENSEDGDLSRTECEGLGSLDFTDIFLEIPFLLKDTLVKK